MPLHFSVTFACCGNVEILVSTWCETEVVQILKMIVGKNFWCADSPGLQVYKSASLQVCKSASLQVCKSASLQVCKSASLQVCKSASLQVCKCRTPVPSGQDSSILPARIWFILPAHKKILQKWRIFGLFGEVLDHMKISGFHMTSLNFKLQNYWSSWDFSFMMNKSS